MLFFLKKQDWLSVLGLSDAGCYTAFALVLTSSICMKQVLTSWPSRKLWNTNPFPVLLFTWHLGLAMERSMPVPVITAAAPTVRLCWRKSRSWQGIQSWSKELPITISFLRYHMSLLTLCFRIGNYFMFYSFNGNGNALEYLARYAYRPAISNSRIHAVDDTNKSFRYTDYTNGKQQKVKTVSGIEFLRF